MLTATSGAIDRTKRAGSRSALGYGYPSTSAVALKDVACRGWRCGRREERASVGVQVSMYRQKSVDDLLSRCAARMITVVRVPPNRLAATSCAQSDGKCLARLLQTRVEAPSDLSTPDSALIRSFALVSPHVKGRARVEGLWLTSLGLPASLVASSKTVPTSCVEEARYLMLNTAGKTVINISRACERSREFLTR